MTKQKVNNLSDQIHLHNLDTSAFFNEEEMKIQTELSKISLRKYDLKKRIKKLQEPISADMDLMKEIRKQLKLLDIEDKVSKLQFKVDLDKLFKKNKTAIDEIKAIRKVMKPLNAKEKENKLLLKEQFPLFKGVRTLRESAMTKKTIISMFSSTLSRVLDIQTNTTTEDIIVVETYYHDILDDIVMYGFLYKGEEYLYLTASAGQIRDQKNLYIKRSVWDMHKYTLMCGIDIDLINDYGGMNSNKFLSYTALFNSATEVWKDFNIDDICIVEDFETNVLGDVDHIDLKDEQFKITRVEKMSIPVMHTDGCGICLPSVSTKSFQLRGLPWIKGLVVPFSFDKFARLNGNSYWITDIYKNRKHIFKDKIKIILTRSQFKAWKFYASWEDYKAKFIFYKCEAARCNIEDDVIGDAKLNYQMLSSLNEMSPEDIKTLSEKSRNSIKMIGSDKNTMLRVLGVTKSNTKKNFYQQALEIYPELLVDTYARENLKDVKASLVKKTRAGKLEVAGRYTFIIPDLVAFCQRVFLNHKHPVGILKQGEVSCKLFKKEQRLDVLRSPHLYREHFLATNKLNSMIKKWFITDGIYMNSHDLSSKLLFYDSDGDKAVVVSDETLIRVAEDHMKGIVPLYFEMKSADSEKIDNSSILGGLKAAYTGVRIGEVSNNICKVWSSGKVDLDILKYLVMQNNFAIDYAKTKYMITFPEKIQVKIDEYTSLKVPYYFTYAKNKTLKQVEPKNDCLVNRLEKLIPTGRLQFTATNLGLFNYKMLMKNKKVELDQAIIEIYTKLDRKKKFMTKELVTDEIKHGATPYIYREIREQILKVNGNLEYVVDVLVKHLYRENQSKYKTTLWLSFGDVIVNNLLQNVENQFSDGYDQCLTCGERFLVTKQKQVKCDECLNEIKREKKRIQKQKERNKKSNVATKIV